MGPVGLVHQHWDTSFVGHGTDPRRVTEDPIIGGTGGHHQLELRRQGRLDHFRGNGAREALRHRGQQVHRLQAAELHGVVNGLVAVPGH